MVDNLALKETPVRSILKTLALLVLGCAFFAAPTLKAQDLTLKLGTLAPDGSVWDKIMHKMGEAWKTSGVKLSIYPGGVLGDEPDMVSKMRIGQLQVGVFTVVGLGQIDKGVQVLSVPMMYRDYAESDYVRSKMQPILEANLLKKGFKVLNWGDAGWVMFFGKQPILTPDDLKKAKFFVWGDDADTMSIWKSAGYSPIPLAATDILPNLQTGLINSFDTTPISALSFQWFALAPHMTDMRWAPLVGATVITTKAWAKVPASVQPALLKAAQEAGVSFREEIRSGEAKAIEVMKKKGLVVHEITPDQYAQWEALNASISKQIGGTVIPQDILDKATAFRDEYRAKHRAAAK